MLEFVLERGNYWAIIGLMMIGLYMAFSSTNLIKRLIGLGTFQTSIILFYISLSRVSGGTAPILFGGDYPGGHGGGHGDGHGHHDGHGGGHGNGHADAHAAAHNGSHGASHQGEHDAQVAAPMAGIDDHAAADGHAEAALADGDNASNHASEHAAEAPGADGYMSVDGAHADDKHVGDSGYAHEASDNHQATELHHDSGHAAVSSYEDPTGVVSPALENVYSNPLPHVLMLTAIVVGVATLAVGLAVIVRIREAYGTVEMDEIIDMDRQTSLADDAADADKINTAQGALSA